jgi:hypothetical protein
MQLHQRAFTNRPTPVAAPAQAAGGQIAALSTALRSQPAHRSVPGLPRHAIRTARRPHDIVEGTPIATQALLTIEWISKLFTVRVSHV